MKMKRFSMICLLTVFLFSAISVVMAEDDRNLQGLQDDLKERIAQSGNITDAIKNGDSLEDIMKMYNGLEPIDTKTLDSILPIDTKSGAPVTGSLVGTMDNVDLGPQASLQFLFAKLQLELSQQSKNQALDYIKKIEQLQAEQKEVAQYISQARELQSQAKDSLQPMPEAMKDFMDKKSLAYDRTGDDNLHNSNEWDYAIRSLQAHQEQLGADTQKWMVYVQDFMGQYNSYLQGANSAIQRGNDTLSSLARGQSLFSLEGGKVNIAPIATSVIVGVIFGMLIMWAILREKEKKQAKGDN